MRERITFVQLGGDGVDPAALELQHAKLSGPKIEAVREDRLTMALDELQPELAEVLQDYEEVHLRERLFSILGLNDASKQSVTSYEDTYSSQPLVYYYYENIQQSDIPKKIFSSKLCLESDSSCIDRVEQLATGSSNVDLSYDGSAKTVKLTAFWPHGRHDIDIPSSKVRRVEVGIMTAAVPPNIEAHDIGVTGVLIVLGESKDPSPTMFSFPARHRISKDEFSTKFLEPTGLHPTLQLSLSGSQPPAVDGDCAAYAYLTLPRTVFADRYQLEDKLFMTSKNLTALRYTSLPVDLEAPAYTTKPWGSSMLLELAPPAAGDASREWTAEVPLHLRYLEPSATGERSTDVPYPAVFWACSVLPSGPFSQSPFDRRKLGYDGLFDPMTVFWHLEPRLSAGRDSLTNPVTVPVMKEEGAGLVGIGTTGVILLGFVWVLWKLGGVCQRAGYGRVSVGADKKRN